MLGSSVERGAFPDSVTTAVVDESVGETDVHMGEDVDKELDTMVGVLERDARLGRVVALTPQGFGAAIHPHRGGRDSRR